MLTSYIYFTDNDGCVEGLSHEGIHTKLNIKFEDVLAFATGASTVPPMGFIEQPSLCFQTESLYPRANTCSNVIFLSLIDVTFDLFVYYMTHGILNTAGFGQV